MFSLNIFHYASSQSLTFTEKVKFHPVPFLILLYRNGWREHAGLVNELFMMSQRALMVYCQSKQKLWQSSRLNSILLLFLVINHMLGGIKEEI